MQCTICAELEQSFVNVRLRWLDALKGGSLTSEEADRLSRAELEALVALLEHRAEHRRPALPARRSLGGIITPS